MTNGHGGEPNGTRSIIESAATQRRRGTLPRAARPERIVIAGETMTRNDVKAKELGESEKSLNRRDKLGAPYIILGGCKYRPPSFDTFMLSRIRTRTPPTPLKRKQKVK